MRVKFDSFMKITLPKGSEGVGHAAEPAMAVACDSKPP